MAQYRLIYVLQNGTGTFTVNGSPPSYFYEEGTSLELETIADTGFTVDSYNVNAGFLFSTDNPYTFNMPSQDIFVLILLTGSYAPSPDDYGLKYYSECQSIIGQTVRIDILNYLYVGASTEKTIRVNYRFGDFGSDEIDPIVRSYLNITIYGNKDEYVEMLNGGYRAWMVRVTIDGSLFWEGYINNNVLSYREISIDQDLTFTASDGLNSFDSQRVIEQYFAGFVSGSMLGGLFGVLNQTFPELRPLNVACEIYETRLDRNDSVFEQLLIPPNSLYTDGEIPIYYGDGQVALNTAKFISEFLDSLLTPFLCRVFLWKNEFYIISTPEFAKNDYRLFKYDLDGNYISTETIDSGFQVSCNFTDGSGTARSVFTEFTASLYLGVLDYSSRGGIYEEKFDVDSWYVNSPTSPYAGIYQLRRWKYINCVPSNQVVNFPSVVQPSGIQYVGTAGNEYLKFWGTTDSVGLADPNLSYIELDTTRTGDDIPIAQEVANKISFNLEFNFIKRSSSEPLRSGVFCGVQIQIGSSYLEWDGNQTFSWTLTPTVMQFPALNLETWNTLAIESVVVPENGALRIRLYEVIVTNVQAEARYSMAYRNLSLKIEENEAFVTEEISYKGITDTTYTNVYPEVKLNIGDVATANSSSAIRINDPINDNPRTELWSRDEVEEEPIIKLFLQELSNIKGKNNPRIVMRVPYNKLSPIEIKPYQNIPYDGYLYFVNALKFNPMMSDWEIEIVRLGEIPTS